MARPSPSSRISAAATISGWCPPTADGPRNSRSATSARPQPTWSPDGKWIAYISDYDGDEQWDIFFVSPKTGQVINITNTREISEESPTWSPNGRYLAYTVKPKTSSVFEIDIFDTLMRDTKHLTTGTPKDKMNVESHLVRRQQMDRLYPTAGQGHGFQYLRRRSRHRQKHAAHAASGRSGFTPPTIFLPTANTC